jgi:adenylosuccinate lyase
VFHDRLHKQRARLAAHRFEAKLNGAVGNFNALAAAAPQVDWPAFSAGFIRALGLEPNLITTQILPYDNWLEYFQALHLANSVLVDFAEDVWHYISAGLLGLKAIASEAGSSTMPQKVNPIDFENAEGNLGIANALLEEYLRKLPVSRLQRDLSDSTVRRTFGVALGHTLVAYGSLARGLERVDADPAAIQAELEAHWEIVAEGAQTILRSAGVRDAYEKLKTLTRGRTITREAFLGWVQELAVEEPLKEKLRALSPLTYTGRAGRLARRALDRKPQAQGGADGPRDPDVL